MAYQPIEMGAHPPMLDAMDQLAHSIGQVGQIRRQNAQYDDEQKRQEQQDYQQALIKAQEFFKAGDVQGGMALLQRWHHPQGLPPTVPPGAGKVPTAPKQPQGGSPMPDAAEFAQPQMRPSETADDFDLEHGQAPNQLPPPPGRPEDMNAMPMGPMLAQGLRMGGAPLPGAPPQGPAPGAPPPPAPNPLIAAAEGTRTQDQARARNLVHLTAPGGQDVTIDPYARDRERERQLAELDQAVAQSGDQKLQGQYKGIRPFLLSGEAHPADVFRYMRGEDAAAASAEALRARLEASTGNQEANRVVRREAIGQSDVNSQRAADARKYQADVGATGGTGGGLKASAATTAAASRFDTEWTRFETSQDLRKVRGGIRQLDLAATAVHSGNPLAEHDAQISLARAYRGTIPTEGEMHLLYGNLAGRLGDALPRFLEDMGRGGLDDAQKQILAEAVDVSRQEFGNQLQNIAKAARRKFGKGSGHENFAGNVNANFAAMMAGAGIDDAPPVYEGEDVPTVTVGAANPLMDANTKKKPKGTTPMEASQDSKYIKWAKAHINDPDPKKQAQAAEILKVNKVK